jgi:hypothetical protein
MKEQLQKKINELTALEKEQYQQLLKADAELDVAEAAPDPHRALREHVKALRTAWYETHEKVKALESVLAEADGFGQ